MATAVMDMFAPIPATAFQGTADSWLSGVQNTSETLWLFLDVDSITLDDGTLPQYTAWIKDLVALVAYRNKSIESRDWTVIALGKTLSPNAVEAFNAVGAMTAQIRVDQFQSQLTEEQKTAEEWVNWEKKAKPLGTPAPPQSRTPGPGSQEEEHQQFNKVLKELNSAVNH